MLLSFTNRGIYCKQADAYIDPWRPVEKAILTHGHADHARPGHRAYLCVPEAKPVIQFRLGRHANIQTLPFGQKINMNGVEISFHPAGHIIGSGQIRLSYKGEIWVVSGDYKLEYDGLSRPFEAVKCHTFITESTFGLPVFRWADQLTVFQDITHWWKQNKEEGKTTILAAYSLGKAQRLLYNLPKDIGPIYTHGAVENINKILRKQGYLLPETRKAEGFKKHIREPGALVIAPPAGLGNAWIKRFQPYSTAVTSGWMALRGMRRRRAVERGFVLSDHADWEGLNQAITATGAERVFVTHGYTDEFCKWLNHKGLEAHVVKTAFEGEHDDPVADTGQLNTET